MFNAKRLRSFVLVALVAPACANVDGDDLGVVAPNVSDEVGECRFDSDCAGALSNAIPKGCAVAKCDSTVKTCSFYAVDADTDGHPTSVCAAEGVNVILGDDCNDDDAAIFPGAWDGPENATIGKPTSCNQIDNDCDGTPDDGIANGASCICDPATDIDVPCHELADGTPIIFPHGQPQGTCLAGKKSCFNGVWGACEGAIVPQQKDTCEEGNDDNCNGKPNDGCQCVAGTVASCATVFGSQGVCGTGEVTCNADGTWPESCPVEPAAEVCDATRLDENCDGATNEGCACTESASRACGACSQGTQTCVDGQWGECNDAEMGLATYYFDADKDGYCNKNVSMQSCTQPAGYKTASCTADCKDSNGYATTTCSYNFDASGSKKSIWGGGAAQYTWTVCNTGFHVTSCSLVVDSGFAQLFSESHSGRDCTLYVFAPFQYGASVHPAGQCAAD